MKTFFRSLLWGTTNEAYRLVIKKLEAESKKLKA
jgi:hypothetical protein